MRNKSFLRRSIEAGVLATSILAGGLALDRDRTNAEDPEHGNIAGDDKNKQGASPGVAESRIKKEVERRKNSFRDSERIRELRKIIDAGSGDEKNEVIKAPDKDKAEQSEEHKLAMLSKLKDRMIPYVIAQRGKGITYENYIDVNKDTDKPYWQIAIRKEVDGRKDAYEYTLVVESGEDSKDGEYHISYFKDRLGKKVFSSESSINEGEEDVLEALEDLMREIDEKQ